MCEEQRLLCRAEFASCFCFSSSPSLPLLKLCASHHTPSHARMYARACTMNAAASSVPASHSYAAYKQQISIFILLTFTAFDKA